MWLVFADFGCGIMVGFHEYNERTIDFPNAMKFLDCVTVIFFKEDLTPNVLMIYNLV
jgi:hypothetical protein